MEVPERTNSRAIRMVCADVAQISCLQSPRMHLPAGGQEAKDLSR